MTETKGLAQSSVCLRSKRSLVRIQPGVPETNNLGAEQTTPDPLPEAAKGEITKAECEQALLRAAIIEHLRVFLLVGYTSAEIVSLEGVLAEVEQRLGGAQ